jgi:hypothetical protein
MYDDEAAILLAQAGPLNGQRWSIKMGMLIGRDDKCDIVISDRQVSRQHAKIFSSPEGIYLEDLGSKNGTHRNGEVISNSVKLQDGDLIQIALAQGFIFLSSDATLPLDSQLLTQNSPNELPAQSSVNEKYKLRLDRKSKRVWITIERDLNLIEEVEIAPALSLAQFRLLEELYINQGRVISRFDLISAIWGESQALQVSIQALDALVRRLRDRLAAVDPTHSYIITVRGHGLRLDNPTV